MGSKNVSPGSENSLTAQEKTWYSFRGCFLENRRIDSKQKVIRYVRLNPQIPLLLITRMAL